MIGWLSTKVRIPLSWLNLKLNDNRDKAW